MIYAAASFVLHPLVLAFLLLTAAACGLAWHGTFSRSGGGHSAPRRALDWDGTETVPRAIDGPREETLVSAGHSANWAPKFEPHQPLPPVAVVTSDTDGRHAAPREYPNFYGPGTCAECGQRTHATSGHAAWADWEALSDAIRGITETRRSSDTASTFTRAMARVVAEITP